jgi:hypothetical protein
VGTSRDSHRHAHRPGDDYAHERGDTPPGNRSTSKIINLGHDGATDRSLAKKMDSGADLLVAFSNRRMSKDYERLPGSVEAFIYVAMSRLMVRRLARS